MTKRDVQKEIESIKEQLISKYHPEKIILFGSIVWGGFNKDSDIDFLVIKNNVPHYGRDRLREIYHFVDTDLPVDMLVYKQSEFDERYKMGDPFIKLIVMKGRVIYG